jgi:hypothetical protein
MVNTNFYSNAKIYKIVDNTNDNIYIGSTCKKLCQRLAQHRQQYKRYLNGNYRYFTSFKILENNNYDIILLEKCENITDKEGLRARERYYIETLDCVNKNIPNRTINEWYNENKDKLIEKQKLYYHENKDKISEYEKQRYIKNKKKILEQKKQYYNDNKQKIREQYKIKTHCDLCNCDITKTNLATHNKSKKHQNNINKD